MPFNHRIRLGANTLVRALAWNRHLYGSALAVDEQAVIATTHVVPLLDPHGQRQQAVRTRVLQSDDRAIELSVEHDGLAADGARKRRAVDLMVPAGDVPLIANIHGCSPQGSSGCALPK